MNIEAELREIERNGDPLPPPNMEEEDDDRDGAMRASDKHFGLTPFTEVIPPFWREDILAPPDSPLK
jgi:hypothetical protein